MEAAAAIAVAVVVVALIVLLSGDHRRLARLGEDLGKLRSIGALTGQYGSDYTDKFWTFSWKKGLNQTQYPDLVNSPTDSQAASNQAIDILRRRTGRPDLSVITQWVPHTLYSHLPLADYGGSVPEETFISSMDTHRLKWSRDPQGFDQGRYQPAPLGWGTQSGKRWPYSASFQLPSPFYDQSLPPHRLGQGTAHNHSFLSPSVILGQRKAADVAFPSQKVHLHDQHGRHFGAKQPYCTHNEARLPLLFVDGNVTVHGAADSNNGWSVNSPTSGAPTTFVYQPDVWEPATVSGAPSEPVIGRFRWTRGIVGESGIKGRDFGGPETCSGQPGCL